MPGILLRKTHTKDSTDAILLPHSRAPSTYAQLRQQVRETIVFGEKRIKQEKVRTYWKTGQLIRGHVLLFKDRADYGRKVLERLSRDVGTNVSVLRRCVQFAETFPIRATWRELHQNLDWSHFRLLIVISDDRARHEMAERADKNNWTVEELTRKIRNEIQEDGQKRPADLELTGTAPDGALLKPKFGTLYTYRLIRPENFHGEERELLIDLGFAFYRLASAEGAAKLKEGDIVTSTGNADGTLKLTPSAKGEEALFTYKGRVERVVDGDTLRVKVDLGFHNWTRQYLRLRGLDTPELNTAAGRKAFEFVKSRLESASFILLSTTRSDKYDRYLSDIFIPKKPASESIADFHYLNNQLLSLGLAVRMN